MSTSTSPNKHGTQSVKTGEALDSYTDTPRSKQLEIVLNPKVQERIKENNRELVSYEVFKILN